MPLVIPLTPGALFRAALCTAFSISGMVMSGHLIGREYWYPSMSERFAISGGRKKDCRRTSAFSSSCWVSSPSSFTNTSMQAGDTLCWFLAHLTKFQRPDCDVDASSTL